MEIEQFRNLIIEFATAADFVTAVGTVDETLWAFEAEEIDFAIEFCPATQTVFLEAPLGVPNEAAAESVYATMLAITGLPSETGGNRMLLSKPGGMVSQELERDVSQLNVDSLNVIAGRFVEQARRATSLIGSANRDPNFDSSAQPNSTNPNAIRV